MSNQGVLSGIKGNHSLHSKRFCGVQGSRPIFHTDKTPKIPSLCLSLLPNATETLATLARVISELI